MFQELLTNLLEITLDRVSPTDGNNSSVSRGIRELIAAEANAIDETMRNLDVFAWVVDEEIVVSSIGGFIRYTIETGPSVKASKVKAIREDIEIAVNRARQKLIGGEYVELSWNRGLSFDLPYPGDRAMLDWDRIPETKSIRPMQMVAGLDYTGFKPFTKSIMFAKGETTHLFVGGGTGSGKSVAVCGLIASLCMGTSPRDLQIIVIDIKRCKDLAKVAGFPHITMHHEPEEAIQVLEAIYAEMRRRQKGADDSAKIVVVIEEMSELIALAGKDAVMRILNGLSKTARSAGIHMITCTQYPSSKVLDREFMVNFDVKMCGAFSSKQAMRQALDVEDFTGTLLPGKGAFYVNHSGNISRIQTPALFDERLLDVVSQARAKWHRVRPYRIELEVEADESEETVAEPEESITPTLDDFLESIGSDGETPGIHKIRTAYKEFFGEGVGTDRAREIQQLLENSQAY